VYGLVAVLAVGAIGAGMATGAKKKSRTKAISFQSSAYGDSFSGKVKSKGKKKIKKKCKKGRNVIVIRKAGNQKQKIGKTKSKKKGRWALDVGGLAEPGNYFAKVKKKVKKKGGNKIVCKKGKSPTISVS
jgi:hypothetical protein